VVTDPLADALSDADLIQRSLGEPDCFAAILERHADQILRYAHARLGADLAEDVTAETFLAAFRRRAAGGYPARHRRLDRGGLGTGRRRHLLRRHLHPDLQRAARAM
jgi:hypothetical protein